MLLLFISVKLPHDGHQKWQSTLRASDSCLPTRPSFSGVIQVNYPKDVEQFGIISPNVLDQSSKVVLN